MPAVPRALLITIADQGMPVDPRAIPEYDARGGLDRDVSGLPFHLIQQAMDEVHFVNRGWKGKELQLTKYLKVPGVEPISLGRNCGPMIRRPSLLRQARLNTG